VVGQYGSLGEKNWSGDWLPSESGFDAQAFEAVWQSVADFIADSSEPVSQTSRGAADAEPAAGPA
jgi:hypothetical protein